MDKTKFSDRSSGKLVRADKDWAFIPDPLPPSWSMPGSLWPLLVEAQKALGKLDGIGQTLPDPQLLLQPLQSMEALRSSSLEGTYASPRELLLFELNPRAPTSETDKANDWLEVSNYGRALREGCSMLRQYPLSLRVIREMHRRLLTGVRGRDRDPGEFRRLQVHIGADRRFIPPPPQYVGDALGALEVYMNQETQLDPLVKAYLVHYQFEAIHPFLDGNGRVGRLLMALTVYQWCGLRMPWLYMSAFFEKYKDEYIDKLFGVSTSGDWESWIGFCLRGTAIQAKDSIARCEKLQALRRSYHDRLSAGSVRLPQLVDQLFFSPVVEVSKLARKRGVSYPTARKDIDRLVTAGILVKVPSLYPRTFYCPGIFDIAYGESIEEPAGPQDTQPRGE